jgi:hypothetical protein
MAATAPIGDVMTENFDSKIDFKLDDEPQWLFDMAYMLALKLQAIRDYIGVPVYVTSFYRSPSKNANVKYAASKSLHTRGLAVDFTVSDRSLLLKIYEFCKNYMEYGELFLYETPDGTLNSIHLSLPALYNYKETLRYIKGADGKLIKRG